MTASADIFQHRGRAPRASINYVTVHDGFTLADLVSYEQKHNEANGEGNNDGSPNNDSTNCGVEGPTDDPEILELRRTLRRNQLACLFLAQGMPIMLAGDEVGNTQFGNNNPYCQDNEIGWVKWTGLGKPGEDMIDFIGQLTALRARYAQLRPRRWLRGARPDGSREIAWLTPKATEMTEQDWHFPEGRFVSYVLAPVEDSPGPVYVVINGTPEPIDFTIAKWTGLNAWRLRVATVPFKEAASVTYSPGQTATGPARSVTVFSGAV
jgi:glycogen operon protein